MLVYKMIYRTQTKSDLIIARQTKYTSWFPSILLETSRRYSELINFRPIRVCYGIRQVLPNMIGNIAMNQVCDSRQTSYIHLLNDGSQKYKIGE